MDIQLERYIETRSNMPETDGYSCDTQSSSVRVVKIPIPATLERDLQALGAMFGYDPACLGGDLLAIAIQASIDNLPSKLHHRFSETKNRLEQARITRMKIVDWCETGGT